MNTYPHIKPYTAILRVTLLALTLVLFAACDLIPTGISKKPSNDGMEVTGIKLSDDYRNVDVTVKVNTDIGFQALGDTANINVKVRDILRRFIPWVEPAQPRLVKVEDVGEEQIQQFGLKLLVMVDLTLPANAIDAQRTYLEQINTLFCRDNLFVAFMLPKGKITPVMPLTKYVLSNYVKADSHLLRNVNAPKHTPAVTPEGEAVAPNAADGRAYLFRSTATILDQMQTVTSSRFDDARYKALIIFSDGLVYDEVNDVPIDPEHFLMQEKIIQQARQLKRNISVFYVPLNPNAGDAVAEADVPADDGVQNDDPASPDALLDDEEDATISSRNIMRMLCTQTNGMVEKSFDWLSLEDHISESFGIDHADYVFHLVNPEGKYYFGQPRYLCIDFYDDKGNSIASCYHEYHVGSVYNPVHIGNMPLRQIAMQGILLSTLLVIIIYIVLQFFVPFVRYRIFKHKYVINYRGNNMSAGNIKVPDHCYYCKAPFLPGDEIVVKCQHVMHKECWDENDGHCPEWSETHSIRHAAMHPVTSADDGAYSDTHTCTKGSHFYDRHNLFNPRNATYYLKWIVFAALAAILAWVRYIIFHHPYIYDGIFAIVELFVENSDNGKEAAVSIDSCDLLSARQLHLVVFACYASFFTTLALSMLTTHRSVWYRRTFDVLMRAVTAALMAFLVFTFGCIVVAVTNMYDGIVIFDLVEWIITALTINMACTIRSRVRMQRRHYLYSVAAAVACTLLWWVLGDIQNVQQIVALVFAFVLFAIGMAMSIARHMPRNDHAFLNVTGAIKEMDIALYKWLRQNPDYVVTLGRSVECSLQITWDLQADISPVHAEIYRRNGVPYIRPVDGMLTLNGRDAKEDREYALYHDDKFVIGNTVFRYIEV